MVLRWRVPAMMRLAVIALVGIGLLTFYMPPAMIRSSITGLSAGDDFNDDIFLNNIDAANRSLVSRLRILGLKRHDLPVNDSTAAYGECRIPKLSIYSPELTPLLTKAQPLRCPGEKEWLKFDENNVLVLTDYAKAQGFTAERMKCSLTFYERVSDLRLKSIKVPNYQVGSKPADTSETVEVMCSYGGRKWHYLFMNFVPSAKAADFAAKSDRPKDWSGLSVLIVSFDSLSQMAFRRHLNKTAEYFETKMGGVVLNGYNIVGDGTPQAFIPILTAKTEEELPLTRKRYPEAKFVDVYPFIWKDFVENGYVTGYGEDAAAIGTFTYRLKGFKRQPTIHYTRPFFQKAETFFRRMQCSGTIPQHRVWLDYISNFQRKYAENVPKFLLMHHSMLSHDDIANIENADADLEKMLSGLFEGGHLEKTMVILMADHGHRFSNIRGTQQGQLEERLPFVGIYLPKSFKESEAGALGFKNLQTNVDRLSSPFDLHATLMDLLHFPTIEELKTPQESKKERSLSLFREIPNSRTCAQAGIAPHWCTCLSWQPAYATDETKAMTDKIAKAIVQAINDRTKPERALCSEIRLEKVLSSQRLIPNEKLLKYTGVKDTDGFVPKLDGHTPATFATYQIRLQTTPNAAVYDTTVYYDAKLDEVTIDHRSISHINRFGDDPHCIIDKNYFLATYCVCYDKIRNSPDSK